jgi:hypothetical protein
MSSNRVGPVGAQPSRDFPDKREVLFDGTGTFVQIARDAVLAASSDLSPLDAALAGMVAAGESLKHRQEHARRRAQIIAANPSLRERDLLKREALLDATTEALRQRGVTEPTASLAAHSAVTVLYVAFQRWLAPGKPPSVAACIKEAAEALRALK